MQKGSILRRQEIQDPRIFKVYIDLVLGLEVRGMVEVEGIETSLTLEIDLDVHKLI